MTAVAVPSYSAPEGHLLDESHVEKALDFLVAIEPDPQPDTIEDYRAAIAPYQEQAAAAIRTIRRFAEETTPMSLEQLQRDYYAFLDNPRYRSPMASAVIRSALNQAWHGVGGWQR